MNPRWRVLYAGELRRALTPMTIVLTIGMTLLTAALNVLPLQFVDQAEGSGLSLVAQTSNTGLQMILALLLAGIVANDVRNRWLRTLLTRPVTREHYLRTKMAVIFTIGMTGILVASLAAVLYVSLVLNVALTWNAGELALLLVLIVFQGGLLTAILAFLSCWLPGYMNLVAIAVWAIAAKLLEFVATRQWWDQPIATTLVQFSFPSGFSEAIDAVTGATYTPTAEILWGLASLSAFLALAHFSIARLRVEKGSDE